MDDKNQNSFTFHIKGYGSITNEGIVSKYLEKRLPHDKKGSFILKRDDFMDTPYLNFGKLQSVDKYCFAAAYLALKKVSFTSEKTAIVLVNKNGSIQADREFMQSIQSGFPSPSIFASTLPSSAITDIAIFHKIKGPNRVFCGGINQIFFGFKSVKNLFLQEYIQDILFIYADINKPVFKEDESIEFNQSENAVFAFLFSKKFENLDNVVRDDIIEVSDSNVITNEKELIQYIFNEIHVKNKTFLRYLIK